MRTIILTLAVLIAAPVTAAMAQQDGVTRTELVRHDLSEPGREAVQVRVDFAPGVSFPAHSHPGEEIAYVIEGILEYRLEGRPPVTLKPGESLFIPAGIVHTAANVGDVNAAELATYIVAKDVPIVEFHPISAASN
jgi:quercetin dioxygenase-like cupin family protein